MLKYMSYHYIAEEGSIEVYKEWIKKDRLTTKRIKYKSDSAKALKKYREFLRLVQEQKRKIETENWDKKLLPPILSLNKSFIIL
jgi:hypothetical protein